MANLPAENQVPLIVDLDGTLIKTDLMWESLALRLQRNPFAIFIILFWWMRGRALLKERLGKRVRPDPANLPRNEKFLTWLHQQKNSGRKIVLATASDFQMAKPVADYFGIFDEVLASDGHTNLRAENKLKALVAKYGERGFDYAGNSSADLAVWRGARKAIVVNASGGVQNKAKEAAEVVETFCETNSSLATLTRFLNELFVRSGYLLAVLAGLLLATAFPKVDFAGGAWIAPGLLAFAAHNKRGGDAFRVGVIAGLSFWLTSLYWLMDIPYRWHSIPLGPGAGWLALTAVLSLFFGTWTWLISDQWRIRGFWAGRLAWSLAGAAAWVALEMIRARILGGFPWNFLGASQFKMIPLIQIASITGVYGVSLLVVWTSLSFYSAACMIFASPKSRFAWQPEVFPPLFAVAILFALGGIKLNQPVSPTATMRVALVQPSIPQDLIWDESANSKRFQQLLRLSENALTNDVDLLVWPESAVPEFNKPTYDAITNLAEGHRVWLIFNADDVVPRPNATNEYDNDYFNAAFLVGPDGRLRFDDIYHKQKLVMFGEYIPLVNWLPFVKWFTPITGGYTPGSSTVTFDLENLHVTASPLICYEDLFPQIGRKAAGSADFLINLTNDGWFGQSAEQWQHEMGAIFRAVENGIPIMRSCNNGVTCWIDAAGRQRKIFRDDNGSVYGEGVLIFDLPIEKNEATFYTRHGDWFGWNCVGIALVLLGFKVARR